MPLPATGPALAACHFRPWRRGLRAVLVGVWATAIAMALSCSDDSDNGAGAGDNPPAAPSAPVVTGQSPQAVTLGWDSVPSADSYVVYRGVGASGPYVRAGTSGTPSYTDSGVVPYTIYYYRVSAANAAGESGLSPQTAVRTTFPPPLPPDSVTVTFDSVRVHIGWGPPQDSFTFHRIYRTTAVDSLGRPDTAALVAGEERDCVPAGATSFTDVPGLADGVWYYAVRAVRVTQGDTLESALAPAWPNLASCVIGSRVRFTVNHGAAYASTRVCTLTVSDPGRALVSVRFTQVTIDTLDSAGVRRAVQLRVLPVITGDTYGQVRELFRCGWYGSTQSGSVPGMHVDRIPVFDTSDGQNGMQSRAIDGTVLEVTDWRLARGLGTKFVYAEVMLAGGGRDTLQATIPTAPWQPVVNLVACEGYVPSGACPPDAYCDWIPVQVLHRPALRFTVTVPVCYSGMSTSFDCWIAIGQRYATLTPTDFRRKDWFMTRPVHCDLSGACHDSSLEYGWALDTAPGPGRQNLMVLKAGKDTVLAHDRDTSYVANMASFVYLLQSALDDKGKKQFLLVTRFVDTAFSDTITQILGQDRGVETERTCFDFYLPQIHVNTTASNPDHLGNDSVVTGPFSFALDPLSVLDSGYAEVVSVELLIARKPDGMVWDKAVTPATVTRQMLAPWTYYAAPFPIPEPDSLAYVPSWEVHDVRWDDIDATAWVAGEYIMGVYIRDEYGQDGFANVWKAASTNPWLVRYSPP